MAPPKSSFAVSHRKKERAIVAKSLDVLAFRQDWTKIRERQEKERNHSRTLSRLSKWRGAFDIAKRPDHMRRPSDRVLDVRLYSRMDTDLWNKSDLRDWFQINAKEVPETYDPDYGGYMIRY